MHIPARQLKKCRGIIVWDFDRVLFDTDRFIRDKKMVFIKHGVPSEAIRHAYDVMYRSITRTTGRPFSLALLFELLRSRGVRLNEKKLRRAIYLILSRYRYLDPLADRILHRLRKAGFLHIILSFGSPQLQYNKIRIGCGEKFIKHFSKIIVTAKPKYTVIKKIVKANLGVPVFFIDDVKEHLDLAKRHSPSVITIHYSKRHSLPKIFQALNKR